MIYKKIGKCNSLEGFILERTGKTIKELTNIVKKYQIYKIDELKTWLYHFKETGTKVTLVGDYDSDGVFSVLSMLFIFLKLGIQFTLILPKRFSDGYGFSKKILERIDPSSAIITIDNGITSIEAVQAAKERGQTVIILDHHQAGETLPAADLIIDPSAIGEADYTHYCGAGLAFKLAESMFSHEPAFVEWLSPFAAIGTIGDCVELTGDNRKIVKTGLNALFMKHTTLALSLLCEKCRISESSSATDIAFNLVPVINAAGRLFDDGAQRVVNVLYRDSDPDGTLTNRVDELIGYNNERKKLVSLEEAEIVSAELNSSDPATFYIARNINEGLIGIIAGHLCEKTRKPAFVFAETESGFYKGSVRSPYDDVSIIDIIRKHENLLLGCGGHEKAAGISVSKDALNDFKMAIFSELPSPKAKEDEFIGWDFDVNEDDVTFVGQQILQLEPCGEGVPFPVIKVKMHLRPDKDGSYARYLGNEAKHIRFNGNGWSAIGFNLADKYRELCKDRQVSEINVYGRVTDNVFNGRHSIQINVVDFEAAM